MRTGGDAPKKKGYAENGVTLCLMVRLAGFEPTTPWFVAKYSIQLSYSREATNYSSTFRAVFRRPIPTFAALA